MVQIALDPSMLSAITKDEDSNCQVVVTIAGSSWPEGNNDPEKWTIKDAQNRLYPWRWLRPTHIKVFWIDEHDGPVSSKDDEIEIKPYNDFDANSNSVAVPEFGWPYEVDAYPDEEADIDRVIFDEKKVRLNEVQWAYSNNGKDIEVSDKISDGVTPTGYLKASVAQLAQRNAPLNQARQLVFFGEKVLKVPAGANSFIAFPINKNDNGQWQAVGLVKGGDGKYEIVNDHYKLRYVEYNGVSMVAYSPVTPFPQPQPATDKQPIRVRDDKGNFDGSVDIAVDDVEDWMPGVLNRMSVFFDSAGSFLSYLIDIRKSIVFVKGKSDYLGRYKTWMSGVDALLWSLFRDGVGLGFEPLANGSNIVALYAKKSVDKLMGEEHELEGAKKEEYWKEYNRVYSKYYKLLENADKSFDLKKWKEVIEKLPAEYGKLTESLWLEKDIENATEENVNEVVTKWREAWGAFLKAATENKLQIAILAKQWEMALGAEYTQTVGEDLRDALEQGVNVAALQKEVIANDHAEEILGKRTVLGGNVVAVVSASLLASVEKYLVDRNGPMSGSFPLVSDVLKDAPDEINVPATINWASFVAFSKERTKKDIADSVDVIFPGAEKTYDVPPPIRITVDRAGIAKQANKDDDLNDEIAGHLVLMQRSADVTGTTYSADWRCVNRVLLKNAPAKMPFALVPSFLPETSGMKMPYLELKNEKLSLVAGHTTFLDPGKGSAVELPYKFDPGHPGYGLWYGFHYRFAGFVALNSGVLPKDLRRDPNVWNIPKDSFKAGDIKQYAKHRHLRRVPVSKVRVVAKRVADGKTTEILPIPKELAPLSMELPEWNKQVDNRQSGVSPNNEQSLFVLSHGDRYKQEKVMLSLRKPTTSFWNWYACMGKDAAPFQKDALTKDLELRDPEKQGTRSGEGSHLCDPLVENKVLVVVQKLFPEKVLIDTIEIDLKNTTPLSDVAGTLNVSLGNKTEIVLGGLNIADGDVVQIKVHALVNKELIVEDGKRMFHPWMNKVFEPNSVTKPYNGKYYLTHPIETWFEAAKRSELSSEQLWRSLIIETDKKRNVVACIDRSRASKKIFADLAYMSKLVVKHQVWNWNGRLDGSDLLKKQIEKLDPDPNVRPTTTTDAMKWEAWAFADRPDLAAMVHETNITASRGDEKETKQGVFTDLRPGNKGALYYRFCATAYSRYAILGAEKYDKVVETGIEVDKVNNRWRRYLLKSTLAERLPRPSIKFAIPLTRSVSSANSKRISGASIFVAMDIHGYAEAKLAEELEFGIEFVKDPKDPTLGYPLAGEDPIRYIDGVKAMPLVEGTDSNGPYIEMVEDKKTGKKIYTFVFKPKGPVGFTFDAPTQTPQLNGCGFILELNDLNRFVTNGGDHLRPWAMIKIAARRSIRKEFHEGGEPQKCKSEWSAKEWVQVLPIINDHIPAAWRVGGNSNDAVKVTVTPDKLTMPALDQIKVNDKLESVYLVFTEKVYDISGNASEKYVSTHKLVGTSLKEDHSLKGVNYSNITDGYVRLLLVLKKESNEPQEGISVWDSLFGQSSDEEIDMNKVVNDPQAALPYVSERITCKFVS